MDGLGGDADAAAVEGHHRDAEALAEAAEEGIVAHLEVAEGQGDGLAGAEAELVLLFADLEALLALLDEEAADPTVALAVFGGVGAGPDDEDARLGARGDPLLLAVEDPAAVDLGGLGLHPRRIAARLGLAEGEGPRDILAARELGDVALTLLVGAEGVDDLAHHVGDGHGDGGGGAAPSHLLHGERVGDHPRLRAPELGREVHAHHAELGEAGEDLRGEAALLVQLGRRGEDPLLGVFASGATHERLGFVELEPHGG